MSAPVLNRKLVLEARTQVPDGAGGYAEDWVALGEVWADVDARTGRREDWAELKLATIAHRITVRAAPVGAPSRPEPGQRFREGTRVYAILAVAESNAWARYLTCFAREEAAA